MYQTILKCVTSKKGLNGFFECVCVCVCVCVYVCVCVLSETVFFLRFPGDKITQNFFTSSILYIRRSVWALELGEYIKKHSNVKWCSLKAPPVISTPGSHSQFSSSSLFLPSSTTLLQKTERPWHPRPLGYDVFFTWDAWLSRSSWHFNGAGTDVWAAASFFPFLSLIHRVQSSRGRRWGWEVRTRGGGGEESLSLRWMIFMSFFRTHFIFNETPPEQYGAWSTRLSAAPCVPAERRGDNIGYRTFQFNVRKLGHN